MVNHRPLSKAQVRASMQKYINENGKISFYTVEGELIRRLAPNKFKGNKSVK